MILHRTTAAMILLQTTAVLRVGTRRTGYFGAATSAVRDDMLRVTPNNQFAPGADFGFIPSQSVEMAVHN